MESDDIDSEFSIVESLSSGDEYDEKTQFSCAVQSIKFTRNSYLGKVRFYSMKLVARMLVVKFLRVGKNFCPINRDIISIFEENALNKILLSTEVPVIHRKRHDFTVFMDVGKDGLKPGNYVIKYSTFKNDLDFANFQIGKKKESTDFDDLLDEDGEVSDSISSSCSSNVMVDTLDDEDGEVSDSISSSCSSNVMVDPLEEEINTTIITCKSATNLRNSATDCILTESTNTIVDEQKCEVVDEDGTDLMFEDYSNDRMAIIEQQKRDILQLSKEIERLNVLVRTKNEVFAEEREKLYRRNDDLKEECKGMKSRMIMLNKQLEYFSRVACVSLLDAHQPSKLTEKRKTDEAKSNEKELRRLFINAQDVHMEETLNLKKKVKGLQMKEAILLRELRAEKIRPSDLNMYKPQEISRAGSSCSLNEFTTVLEQKMEIIAGTLTEQISEMQESIRKMLTEDKKKETNDCDNLHESFVELVPQEAVGVGTNISAAANRSLKDREQDSKDEVEDIAKERLSKYYGEMRRPFYLGAIPNDNTEDQSFRIEASISSCNLTNDESSMSILGSLERSIADEGNSDSNAVKSEPLVTLFSCPICTYQDTGPYSNIEDHFNEYHMEKKCPLCPYTLPCNQEEQLNCHVQVHLDEEDAKRKNRNVWLNFD